MAALLLETACRTQSVCFACVLPMERCGAHRMGSKRRRAAIMLRELATRSSTSATRNALREGATRVDPLLSLRQRLPLATVAIAGISSGCSALRQSHHQPNILKAMNLPHLKARRARASQHESQAQGQQDCDTKRLGSAGGAGTAHLLEQRPRPAGEGADHASARQAGVSRHDADRSAEQQRGTCSAEQRQLSTNSTLGQRLFCDEIFDELLPCAKSPPMGVYIPS